MEAPHLHFNVPLPLPLPLPDAQVLRSRWPTTTARTLEPRTMASSTPPSDATNGPVLSLINQRLCALRKKRKRILHMEESIAPGKRIKSQQQNLRRSKTSVVATIVELKKLRRQLSSTLPEELPLAAQRLPSDDGGEANDNDGTAGGASSTRTSAGVPEMATSSGPANDAAANDGTAGGASSTHASAGVPEMATSSGPAKDAAANDGTAGGASSTHTSTETQGMATSSGYDHEVFLSFSGEDTRAGLTDFLYISLDRLGIRTFKDDKSLRVGEKFPPKLFEAINQSKISIPIFSKGYASSVYCLQELVQMVECQKIGRQNIMPIFYDVAPSEVRYQIKDYAEAFLSHERKGRYGAETICQWKAALSFVGDISGWNLHKETNSTRREGEFAERVAQDVFSGLQKANLVVSDCLVRVDNHVNAIMKKIGALTSETQTIEVTNETRIIGVHGMGGIGKTTVAKMIYNELSNNFKHCCFLSNIREMSERKGIEFLQHQLIFDILKRKLEPIKNIDDGITKIKERLCTKKVLLLLDDVDDKKHMDALAGERNWFGTGSKLIITTRNKEVLEVPLVHDFYEVNGMNDVQSLQLFSKYAFRSDSSLLEYIDQSNRAIKIASGLPLALEVIGSLLGHTEKETWDATLKMLESVPHDKVQSKLKISYDALDFRQKRMFLDIACIFIGYDKDILVHFWDESIFFPEEAMRVLQSMSLIKINEGNEVWMHDHLRDLGTEIVREKSDMKIEKQSRVWDAKEGLNLLRRHKGKKEVEALCLKLDHQQQCCFTYEGFENLSDLRFLELDKGQGFFHVEERLLSHEPGSNVSPSNENSFLLPQLRWLSWHNIPPTFTLTNFFMEDMVFLDLFKSEITDDWNGWSHMKVMKNLKVLDLSRCDCLKRTPNFSTQANLERLILAYCDSLSEIDRSICQLKRLISLDVSWCFNLRKLPDELGDLASLEYISLSGCVNVRSLPETIGNLKSLIILDITYNRIKKLPYSIGELRNLEVAKIGRGVLNTIPKAFWSIEKLEEIEVSKEHERGRPLRVKIGSCIHRNPSLRILRLEKVVVIAPVPRLPESLVKLQLSELHMNTFPDLSKLPHLKELDLEFGSRDSDGKSDGPPAGYEIPRWIGDLGKLESLRLFCPFVTTSPRNLSLPPQLKSLFLYCPNLRRLPTLPSSLYSLRLICDSLCSMEDLSHLKKLSSLEIENAAITEIPHLGCLENLGALALRGLQQVEILPDLGNLNKLRRLDVYNCGELAKIHVQKLPGMSRLMGLREVWINQCNKLHEIEGELPQSLEELEISYCKSLPKLPNLSSSPGLRTVSICRCDDLGEIEGDLPQSVENLSINFCRSLRKLPNMSSLMGLRHVIIRRCGKLVDILGELPQSLEELVIDSCKSLQKLPNLQGLKRLQKVEISRCRNLNVEEISRFLEESVKFVQEDGEWDTEDDECESEGEDDEYEDEFEGEDDESEYEHGGEDDEYEDAFEGEDEE